MRFTVSRSVCGLCTGERRVRIACREGLVQRFFLRVCFVLLAVLAVLGGFGRTVAVVLGREILAIAVVAHCGAPVFACPIMEPRPCPGACCDPWHRPVPGPGSANIRRPPFLFRPAAPRNRSPIFTALARAESSRVRKK